MENPTSDAHIDLQTDVSFSDFETSGKQGFPSFPEFSMEKRVTHSSFTLGAFVSGNEEQFADKAVYCSVPAVLNVWGTQFCEVARRLVSV